MSIKKISGLTDGGGIATGDVLPVLRDGENKKVTFLDDFSFGGIYYDDDTTTLDTTITTAGTYYPIVSTATESFVSAVEKNIISDVSTGNASFEIEVDGCYLASYSCSYSASGNNITYRASIFVNGTIQPKVKSYRKVVQASTVLHTCNVGLVQLVAGDVVDVRFTSDTNGAQVLVNHVSLTLARQMCGE